MNTISLILGLLNLSAAILLASAGDFTFVFWLNVFFAVIMLSKATSTEGDC